MATESFEMLRSKNKQWADLQSIQIRLSNNPFKLKIFIQTFKFISEQFKVDMNTGVTWFIVALISVFDPLAICLLLAYNTTLNFTDKVEKPKDDIKIYQHQDSVDEPSENIESVVEQAKKEAEEEVKNEKIIREIVTEIKEVPVEKIVEKEVIREVSSNKGPHFSF